MFHRLNSTIQKRNQFKIELLLRDMSEIPLNAPSSIKYSKILDMNEFWIEISSSKYKSYHAAPRSMSDIPRIMLKDVEGKEMEFRFTPDAIIHFEGNDTMWYNPSTRINC